jgi:hypothetical protein
MQISQWQIIGEDSRKFQMSEHPRNKDNARKVVETRQRLGELTGWKGPADELANFVATAITGVMEILKPERPFSWPLSIQVEGQTVSLIMEPDVNQIKAVLSLGLFRAYQINDQDKSECIRLLGPSSASSRRDLQLWFGREGGKLKEVKLEKNGSVKVMKHKIVGFGDSAIWDLDDVSVGFSVRDVSWGGVDTDSSNQHYLAVISKPDLGLLYAQHIFSAFMWSIAKKVKIELLATIDETCQFDPRTRDMGKTQI